jgi:hypothetical protein
MNSKWLYLGALLLLFVTACANKTKDNVRTESAQSAVPQPIEKYSLAGYEQDAEGNWVPMSNKRSSFELQRESPHFKGEYEKKAYKTGDYEKKSWWGKSNYAVGPYQGNTDGSRFKIQARQNDKVFPNADKKVDKGDPYQTNTLEYQSARESNVTKIDKPVNDYTESRKRRYVQPSVMDWEERRNLSLEQSRSILGR